MHVFDQSDQEIDADGHVVKSSWGRPPLSSLFSDAAKAASDIDITMLPVIRP